MIQRREYEPGIPGLIIKRHSSISEQILEQCFLMLCFAKMFIPEKLIWTKMISRLLMGRRDRENQNKEIPLAFLLDSIFLLWC